MTFLLILCRSICEYYRQLTISACYTGPAYSENGTPSIKRVKASSSLPRNSDAKNGRTRLNSRSIVGGCKTTFAVFFAGKMFALFRFSIKSNVFHFFWRRRRRKLPENEFEWYIHSRNIFFFPRLIPSLKNPDLSSEIILSRIFDIKKKRKRDKFVAIWHLNGSYITRNTQEPRVNH